MNTQPNQGSRRISSASASERNFTSEIQNANEISSKAPMKSRSTALEVPALSLVRKSNSRTQRNDNTSSGETSSTAIDTNPILEKSDTIKSKSTMKAVASEKRNSSSGGQKTNSSAAQTNG